MSGHSISYTVLQITCVFKKIKSLFLYHTLFKTILMSGNSIGFGEEIKKLCKKMCSVRMLIWSAATSHF